MQSPLCKLLHCVSKCFQTSQICTTRAQNIHTAVSSKNVIEAGDYDVVVPDINERELDMLGRQEKNEHLNVVKFQSKAFPVNGVIHGVNRRLMVALPCRELWKPTNTDYTRKPAGPIINVWFLIDTTSTHSYITEKTMEAIFGEGNRFDWVALSIQRQEYLVECFASRGNFKGANILGMVALREMGASIEKIDWNKGTFTLVQTLPIWTTS